MSPKISFRVAAVFAASILTSHAQNPPLDKNALLKELQAIQTKQQQSKSDQLGKLVRVFRDASQSDAAAMRLYTTAVHDGFDAQGGDARFQGWKNDKRNALESKALQGALRLQLRYLALSLSVAANPKADAPPPYQEIVEYIKSLLKFRDQFPRGTLTDQEAGAVERVLDKPLLESPIVAANLLGPDLQKLANGPAGPRWELVPGAWRKIINLDMRTPMRAAKDPQLIDAWQFEISLASAKAAESANEVARANFQQIELPQIMWGKAKDLIVLGQNDAAIVEMAKVVRGYPDHPDISAWVGELSTILKNDSAAKPPAPAAKAQ